MAALPFIALAASVGGTLYGGIEAERGAKAQQRALEENARLSMLEGEQQAWQTRLEERRATGDLIASLAGTGTLIGSGSNADLVAQNAYQRELEILNLRTRATRQSNNLREQGNEARRQGRAALVGSVFSAVSQAASFASSRGAQGKLDAQADKEWGATKNGWGALGGGYSVFGTGVPRMSVKGG